jgi:hypothetical protein
MLHGWCNRRRTLDGRRLDHAALDRPPAERGAYLALACEDSALQNHVERLGVEENRGVEGNRAVTIAARP